MSIFPTTDIVSDVAEKADSRRLSAGLQRLRGLAASDIGARGAYPPSSTQEVHAGGVPSSHPGFTASLRQYDSSAVISRVMPAEKKPPAMIAAEKFEAFVLQTWLETLLPRTEGGSFGTDGSANVWRSMMAEQLGVQLARSGGVGLQKLLASHVAADDSHTPEIRTMNVINTDLRPDAETNSPTTEGMS